MIYIYLFISIYRVNVYSRWVDVPVCLTVFCSVLPPGLLRSFSSPCGRPEQPMCPFNCSVTADVPTHCVRQHWSVFTVHFTSNWFSKFSTSLWTLSTSSDCVGLSPSVCPSFKSTEPMSCSPAAASPSMFPVLTDWSVVQPWADQ